MEAELIIMLIESHIEDNIEPIMQRCIDKGCDEMAKMQAHIIIGLQMALTIIKEE